MIPKKPIGDRATLSHRHTVVRLIVVRDLRNVKEHAGRLAIEYVTLAGLGLGRLGSAALTHSLSFSLQRGRRLRLRFPVEGDAHRLAILEASLALRERLEAELGGLDANLAGVYADQFVHHLGVAIGVTLEHSYKNKYQRATSTT